MTDNTSKSRFAYHDVLLKYSTTLFTYIWDLKDNDTDFTIEWSIYLRASPYKGRPSICNLCLAVKLYILHILIDAKCEVTFSLRNIFLLATRSLLHKSCKSR